MLLIPERDRDVLYTRLVRHSKTVTNLGRQTRLHLVFKTFLRCPADVSFADKRLKHVSQTSPSPKLTKGVFVTKIYGSLGMIRQYHNHKLQTNPLYHEEEPHNIHETPRRQKSKATSSLFPIEMIARQEWTQIPHNKT